MLFAITAVAERKTKRETTAPGTSVAVRVLLLGLLPVPCTLLALNPHKAITQFTRTVWTQAQGLPQDTIRAIAQTPDGYLWLGTSEGLARFDGYDFVTFNKNSGSLPGDSVTSLSASRSGNLWIGTGDGLARYSDGHFQTFTPKDGLPPGTVTALAEDHTGVLWVVSGGSLSRLENGKFVTISKESLAPVESARTVYEDPQEQLWVGGVGGVVRRQGGKFSAVLGVEELKGNIITAILKDASGLWLAGNKGLIRMNPNGSVRLYTTRDGLPTDVINALCEDRDGNVWVGTYGGLSRLENGRFVSPAQDSKEDAEWVWSLFEDREGDLWVGANSALSRLRDDPFSVYGRTEGLPSDEPIVVHQDPRGRIWVGYQDRGLVEFRPEKYQTYGTGDGLPSNAIFNIRDGRGGDLLISTRGGLSRMHDGRFLNYSVPDPVGRTGVFDAIEDSNGNLWAATASGVYKFDGTQWRAVVRSGSSPSNYALELLERRDGSIWAGSLLNGLWQITNGKAPDAKPHLYTADDGLGSNQIRSLYEDGGGALWIGTFGGGLTMLRDGVFHRFTARDGLLSDNIFHVEDDGRGDFWLSTTRGICRIPKQQLQDFSEGKIHTLTPQNYGTADGLRSAQCAPGFPAGGGGTRTSDGNLWFPTGRGLATLNPTSAGTGAGSPEASQTTPTPIAHIVEIDLDGHVAPFQPAAILEPGTGRVQFRYAGIYLSAPERVRYFYKLDGLDEDWISAGTRRLTNYGPLPHGSYRFAVRAVLPGGGASESQFSFEVPPRFFETKWFLWLCITSLAGAIYWEYRLRLKRVHSRFAMVFEERARLAREIHDTLAQGFVGISRAA